MTCRIKPISIVAMALLLPLGALAAEATAPAPEVKTSTKAKAKQQPAEECESTAATRIHRNKSGKCLQSAQPVRTYTKEEIDNTGQIDTGEALKRLDPRFQ